MTTATESEAHGDYHVRRFEDGDRDAFLALHDRVFDDGGDEAWFDWKFVSDPYTDHVPIVVAEHEGDLVGAKATMPFELAAGREADPVVALQPCDTMVHSDHRGRGLYSRMTELMKAHYADRGPALFFNFPNRATLSGSLKHGWGTVTRVPTYYRVQDAGAFVDAGRGLGSLTSAAASVHLRARDALARSTPPEVTVGRHETAPPTLLGGIAARGVPDRLHAHRDTAFYRWRLRNPRRNYTTYVGRRDGTARAAVVVGVDDPTGTVELVETAPLAPGDADTDVLRALVGRVVADHRDARVVAATGLGLPDGVLREYGFLSDRSPPLSAVATPTTLVAYPLADDPVPDPLDPACWALRGLELDTS